MDEHYQQLVEGLEPAADRVRSVEEAQRLQSRVEQLPMADPQRATRDVSSIVQLMLTQQWNGNDRIKVLQTLAAPVAALSAGVEAQIVAESHPLPVLKTELARSSLMLRRQLGQSWCLAVHELCAPTGKVSLLGRRRVTLALNEATAHLAAALVLAYQLHQTPPAGLWQRLHTVYAFAAARRLQRRSVPHTEHGAAGTVHDRYAGSILLAMANPYGFQQQELLDIVAAVGALAASVVFHADGGGMALVTSTGPDSGPGYLPQDREAPCDGALAVDVRPALNTVEEQMQWTPPDLDTVSLRGGFGASVLIHRSMLARMTRSWQGTVDRGYQRMPAGHTLVTVLGLHAVHQVFADGRNFEAFQRQLSQGEIELGSSDTAASWVDATSDTHGIHPAQAHVLDQSLGGYRLSWSVGQHVRMKIGDIVGLAPESSELTSDAAWLLGLVRWLRSEGDGSFEVGVELLARHAYAAAARSINSGGERSPMHRALLLDDGDGDAGSEIVVPRLFDRRSVELEWSTTGDPRQGQPTVRNEKRAINAINSLSNAYYRVSLGGY